MIQARPSVSQLQRAVALDPVFEERPFGRIGRLCGKADYDRGECPYIRRSLAEDLSQLNKGADGARGEDTCRLKSAVVGWLMSGQPTPEPALEPRCKFGRGFYHDATARLLCPVEYDWSNPQ